MPLSRIGSECCTLRSVVGKLWLCPPEHESPVNTRAIVCKIPVPIAEKTLCFSLIRVLFCTLRILWVRQTGKASELCDIVLRPYQAHRTPRRGITEESRAMVDC